MSNKQKLKRIVDLFTEGDVCFLGDDESAQPICVWVNKCNSIEEEEARMDAQSARTQFLLSLADPFHPEMQNANMILSEMSDEEIFKAAAEQKYEENLTLAVHDVESDEEWTDKLDYIRRQPELLDDAGVAEDDPRRKQLDEYNSEYVLYAQGLLDTRNAKTLEEVTTEGREKAEKDFIESFKDKKSIEHYVIEGKITRLFYAIRECEAQRTGDDEWDHSKCDHGKRLLSDRSEIRELPDHVLSRISATYDQIGVGAKNVANFPEAPNSSESSAP